MAIERRTIFVCDGCGESESKTGNALPDRMVPEGWQLLKCTNDETRYFVKLTCRKCFRRVCEIFKTTWGAETSNEARG